MIRPDQVHVLRPIVERVWTAKSAVKVKGQGQWRHDEPLDSVALDSHLNGGLPRGTSPITPGTNVTRLALFDLDSHKGEIPWDMMLATGARISAQMEQIGLRTTAFRSTGGSGLHLYAIWDEPQDAYSVRHAMMGVLQACGFKPGTGGVVKGEIEIFPKQAAVLPDRVGSMFILPLAGKSEPIDLLFGESIGLNDVLWRVSEPVTFVETPVKVSTPDAVVSPATLRSALWQIPNESRAVGPNYEEWRDIVFGIHDATGGSETGLEIALEFSLRNADIVAEKGADGVEQFLRERVWQYVRSGGGVTHLSILAKAREASKVDGVAKWERAHELDFKDLETGESADLGAAEAKTYKPSAFIQTAPGEPETALGLLADISSWHDVTPGENSGAVVGPTGAPVALGLVDEHLALRNSEQRARDVVGGVTDLVGLSTDAYPVLRDILAKFPALHKSLYELVSAKVKELGSTLTRAEFAAAVKAPHTPTVKTKSPLTEFGNADRMISRYGDKIMYVPEIDQWYVWTGVYWRRAEGNECEIEHFAQQVVRDLVNEADEFEHTAEFFQFCAASQKASMVKAMLTLIKGQGKVVVPYRMLDAHAHLIGAKNGVIDLRTGELITDVNPKMFITLTVGCDYDPTARAPLFEQTIRDAFFNNIEMCEYMMRAFGYALMANPIEDKMFIAFGNGSNGKSTIINAVRETFGDYAKSADASSFISNDPKSGNAGGPREDIVRLRGSRFVYVNEPDEGGELREGTVKSMTGGDSITARTAYAKTSVEVRPTWVVFMPTNHKPIIKGSDNGIWRRMELIPFERNFKADKSIQEDPHRRDKVLAEKVGILTLLVQAAMRYQKIGLVSPPTIREARDQYRSDMDILAEWLGECCEIDSAAMCEMGVLWKSWEAHAKDRGLLNYIRSSSALSRRLDSRFPAVRTSGGTRVRLGLRLKPIVFHDVDDLFK